jgi:hypothetical protein
MEVAIRTLIVLALALLAPQMVRADLVTYNMTGTIWYLVNKGNLPVHVGDRIGWTLQYDRSLPPTPGITDPNTKTIGYIMSVSPLLNFVDLTTHTPLNSPTSNPSPQNFGIPNYGLSLTPGSPTSGGAQFTASAQWLRSSDGRYSFADFSLENNKGVFWAKDLAHLQLNGTPFDIRSLGYGFEQATSSAPELEFDVKADPLSSTPEPSSLVLLTVAATVLITAHMCSRWRSVILPAGGA